MTSRLMPGRQARHFFRRSIPPGRRQANFHAPEGAFPGWRHGVLGAGS
jgi:hypothetical protein